MAKRLLVFSQYLDAATIAKYIACAVCQWPIELLDGGAARLKSGDGFVNAFRRRGRIPRTFWVISLWAGGAGLNLTAASHVIHFDRWWNPAVEDQATDVRAPDRPDSARAGPPVHFAGTLEEKIDNILESNPPYLQLARHRLGAVDNGVFDKGTGNPFQTGAIK